MKDDSKVFNSFSFIFTNIFVFVLLFLVCIALIRVNFGGEPIYFSSFLETISRAPVIDVSLRIPTSFLGDWGLFNFLRDFIRSIIEIVNFSLFIINGLVNALSFLFYYLENFTVLV